MWGWFEDGVPDHGQEEATVQVHVRGGFPDVDGFHSSQPEPFGSSSSLVLYTVDKGLLGQNVLHQLVLILLRICSRSVRPILTRNNEPL